VTAPDSVFRYQLQQYYYSRRGLVRVATAFGSERFLANRDSFSGGRAIMAKESYRDLGKGRRQSPRRSFHYSARVLGPNAVQWDGFLVDISESGAQLEFFDTDGIPDVFSLLVGGNGAVKRACRVVWRTPDRLGVKFDRPPERLPTSPTK
jgi:hypothetical protein